MAQPGTQSNGRLRQSVEHTVAQTARQNYTEVEDLPPFDSLHLTMRMRSGIPPNGSAAELRVPAAQEMVILARKVGSSRNSLFGVDIACVFRVSINHGLV